MVTGDIRATAVAISKDAGILDKSYIDFPQSLTVMEGKIFRQEVGGIVKGYILKPGQK